MYPEGGRGLWRWSRKWNQSIITVNYYNDSQLLQQLSSLKLQISMLWTFAHTYDSSVYQLYQKIFNSHWEIWPQK